MPTYFNSSAATSHVSAVRSTCSRVYMHSLYAQLFAYITCLFIKLQNVLIYS